MSPDMLMAEVGSMGVADWVFLIALSLPPLFVIWSKRVRGGRKVFWVVVTGLLSWLGYVAFVIATRDPKDPRANPE